MPRAETSLWRTQEECNTRYKSLVHPETSFLTDLTTREKADGSVGKLTAIKVEGIVWIFFVERVTEVAVT